MPHALPAPRSPRVLLALLLAVLAVGSVGLAVTPVPASAQLIDNTPQTKDEARAAREAAEKSTDDGGTIPLGAWLGLAAALAIGGAAFFIMRDAGSTVGADDPRRGPAGPAVRPGTARAVPKTMFEGEGSAANPRGKAKKREKAKRQKAARRANRPRR